MKPMPRLLPLVAVAIGGVIAVKALSDVADAPQWLAAPRARAEEAQPPAKRPGALPPEAAASAPIHACAQSPAELAKAAGLSPGELQALQNLGARRGQIDDRERMLDTQLQLLAAAEAKVDAKMKALTGVKAQIQALLGQADQQQQADIDRLVTVYEKMKPADAAAVMATLDDKVRIPVAAKMKAAVLAQILAKMPTAEAKKLTESLAHRFAGAQMLSQASETANQGAAQDAAGTPPAKLAAAGPPDASAPDKARSSDADAAKPPIKIHMAVKKPTPTKRQVAHAKRDTPTLAAAKSASPAPAGPVPATVAQQTAAATAKPNPTPSTPPKVPPATPATPAAGTTTTG